MHMKNNFYLSHVGVRRCAVWSLNVKEEHKVRRKIFGLRKDEVSGQVTKLHNKEVADSSIQPHSIVWIVK
jgi:hypothetical protein